MGLKLSAVRDIFQKGLKKLKKEKKTEKEVVEAVKAPKLSDEAYAILQDLYDNLGPRPSASTETKTAATRIAEKMKEAELSSFQMVPRMSHWMMLSAVVLISFSFLFSVLGLPYIAIIVSAFLVFIVYDLLRLRTGFLFSLFPKAEGTNVHAVLEPVNKVENTVIFTSHHDSAQSSRKIEGIIGHLSLQSAALSFALLSVLEILQLIIEIFQRKLFRPGFPALWFVVVFLVVFAVSMLSLLKSIRTEGECVNGAGDNLSGVAVMLTLYSYFAKEQEKGHPLESTRLIFASFDGEENFSSGSMAWYDEHLSLLTNPVNINFDGLYKEDSLSFLSDDGNGFVQLSASLASRLTFLAEGMGYNCQTVRLPFLSGATDAASAALHGIRATTLTGMVADKSNPAHTEEDTPDSRSAICSDIYSNKVC